MKREQPPRTRLLVLNTHDSGGAGIAMRRLHQNMNKHGFDSVMAVLHKRSGDPTVLQVKTKDPLVRWKQMLWRTALKTGSLPEYYYQNQVLSRVGNAAEIIDQLPSKPDAVIAGWVSHFLSPPILSEFSQKQGVPVLWYLMDMSPLTGGCHYAWECRGYHEGCGHCPALRGWFRTDLPNHTWETKSAAFNPISLRVIPASSHLSRQCASSGLFRDRVTDKILLAVDPETFIPGDRHKAKESIEISSDSQVILVGALSLKIRRKGARELIDALNHLDILLDDKVGKITVVVIGKDPGLGRHIPSRFTHKALGHIHDDRKLADCYRAADFFVCPSIEDSGPMMINESVMTGTPVVSFDMGVAPDLVMTGETGYRATLGDATDLARGMARMLAMGSLERKRLSDNCRRKGLELCHPDVQAGSFARLLMQGATI